MQMNINTSQKSNRYTFVSEIENLRSKIDDDLKILYGHTTFRAHSVSIPPPEVFDGAFIYFRGYLGWIDVPEEDKLTIKNEFILDLVRDLGFEAYWIPQPKNSWVLNEVLRIYSL
jgi:hypothetical protein